jgi:hypothetical protein
MAEDNKNGRIILADTTSNPIGYSLTRVYKKVSHRKPRTLHCPYASYEKALEHAVDIARTLDCEFVDNTRQGKESPLAQDEDPDQPGGRPGGLATLHFDSGELAG